ncbi:MAG: class I SAM-dependent methyltransferase [Acidobacteria bacterium]|nr:class I SAM-dependent methyltransferase [Acidobacteriota bacterium]
MRSGNEPHVGSARLALRAASRVLPPPLKSALVRAVNAADARLGPRLRRLALSARHLGGRYRCPVCEHRVRRFEPLDAYCVENLRRHGYPHAFEESETCNADCYRCPLCGASDRDRLYALYLRRHFRKFAGARPVKVIDFAPSPSLSRLVRALVAGSAPESSYRTADLLMEGVDDRVDITEMNVYGDGSVDFFICSHVLEHVPDDRKALCELYRILRPGGRGILVVPILLTAEEIDEEPGLTDPAERWRRFGQDDHVRMYSKQGFLSRVREAGFAVHQLGRGHFEGAFGRHGITDQSVLYIAEKP